MPECAAAVRGVQLLRGGEEGGEEGGGGVVCVCVRGRSQDGGRGPPSDEGGATLWSSNAAGRA